MKNRWGILALLFAARTVMAFQFQAVGAIGPGLEQIYSVGLDDIGFAIGLYFLPGIVIAIPGMGLGARWGEGRVVGASLGLMALGAAVMALSTDWTVFLVGQGVAGVGGVMLNILMSKMVADWFAGREIATAMSIFINSWPLGIGLSLVMLPWLLVSFGAAVGFWLISLVSVLFACLVLLLYRAPERTGDSPTPRRLARHETVAALASGAVWGLFNAGIAVVFSFGTALLVERGASLEGGARTTSILLWVTAILSPLGGILADRVARPAILIAVGLAAMMVLIPILPVTGGHWAVFAAIGVCIGSIAGAIMALPAIALPPVVRAAGMGIFFTVYYVSFTFAPPLGGTIAHALGSVAAAFWLGGTLELAALAALVIYARTMQNK